MSGIVQFIRKFVINFLIEKVDRKVDRRDLTVQIFQKKNNKKKIFISQISQKIALFKKIKFRKNDKSKKKK